MEANDIVWSIYSDTSNEDIDEWVEENAVGFDNERIADIPSGIYEVNQRDSFYDCHITLKAKVLVWDGKVDIQSSKEAVAEFLNETETGHIFIEGVMFGDKVTKVYDENGKQLETKRTIQFRLGS